MAHKKLRLKSLNSFNCNTDYDDDGCTAKGNSGILCSVREEADQQGTKSNNCQVDSTEQCDLVENLGDEVAGGSARCG